MLTWSQTYLSIIDLVVSRLFVLGAYMGARSNAGWHCQYLRQQFETIWFVGCLRHCHADQIRIARLGVHPLLGAMWPLWVKPLTRSTPRHQFLVQMPKAKVSWLLCIGRLVSKTDNVIHFARLVKQACVDLVSDLFVYYRLGCEPFVCSWGLHYHRWRIRPFSFGSFGKKIEWQGSREWKP